MRILIIEPYLAGSHAAWAEEYSERSTHEVSVLGLPGRHWKWRMHGGALTLARLFMEESHVPEIVLATDMLDLSAFMALTRRKTASLKAVLYMHENQICYPWSEKDPDPARERDAHYGFLNLTSALAADVVVFNSEYHRTCFLEALGPFLRGFPDYNETGVIRDIEARSRVLHLGLDLARLDRHRPERGPREAPLVLWNHRWEYDKNPEDFFHALILLKDEGLRFEVAILGKAYGEKPTIFEEAATTLADRIVQFGYVDDWAGYASWLWKADILPVTSKQDFFGASVVQAIHCGCFPFLPRRLAYPEHVPVGEGRFFYRDFQELLTLLRHGIENIEETRKISARHMVGRYDWSVMGPKYDRFFESVLAREGS
jgi:glycosyltransferase involved in cell wall biosynthesis